MSKQPEQDHEKEKVHLGDGIYVYYDFFNDTNYLVLTDNDEYEPDSIYLKPPALAALLKYLGVGEKEEVK